MVRATGIPRRSALASAAVAWLCPAPTLPRWNAKRFEDVKGERHHEHGRDSRRASGDTCRDILAVLLVRTCTGGAGGAQDVSTEPYVTIQKSIAAGQHGTAVSGVHDQHQMVSLTTDVGGGSGTPGLAAFELARLQARAAGTAFFEYNWMRKLANEKRGASAWATEEQATKLRTMARQCTRLYERALSAAPTAFEKTRIAAEWMALNVSPSFEADSQALRGVLPADDSLPPADREAQSRQTVQFRDAVEKALHRGTQGAQLTPEARKDIVRLFPLEFEQFAGIGIPDAVVDDVVADLDAFLDVCLPLQYIEDAPVFGRTMRWYLWNALTRSLPDEIERAAIDEQVKAFGGVIRTEIDRALAHADLKPLGAEYEARWLRSYHRLKDNRWIPYYKRAIPGYRLDWMTANLKTRASEIGGKFPQEAARPDPWAKSSEERAREIEKARSGYAFALYIAAWTEFARWDGPIYLPVPDAMIWGTTGTLNDYDVYGFAVDDFVPLPPYPIKKYLSQED